MATLATVDASSTLGTAEPSDSLRSSPGAEHVLASLESTCAAQGVKEFAARLAGLRTFIETDLLDIEAALDGTVDFETPAHRSAGHLLRSSGKRLRPMCVALAARVGSGFGPVARDLGVAAELIHSATLLHDDVVDLGDRRRGAPAARIVYGNAASILGGDWLLVEALRRVRATGLADVLDRALEVLRDMLVAEATQLACKGKIASDLDEYFRIAEGKTASLFAWAMYGGARAGDLDPAACVALATYGRHIGVAFQLIDDVLDFEGDPSVVGKSLLADVAEGKSTYPLRLAISRDAALAEALVESLRDRGGTTTRKLAAVVARALSASGALDDARSVAEALSSRALSCLEGIPTSRSRDALVDIATSLSRRRS